MNPVEFLGKSRSTEINYSPIIRLTVKFRTSFVITRRKVCELHPVSRHVRFPLVRSEPRDPPTVFPGFVSKYPVTLERRGEPRPRAFGTWESFNRRTIHAGGERLSLTFPLLPLRWLCASTAGEASSSVHYHLPSSLTLKGPCDAHRSRKAPSLSLSLSSRIMFCFF